MASSSESEDDEENDPCIMVDRNLWSTQLGQLNEVCDFRAGLDDERMSNIPHKVVSSILQLPSSDGVLGGNEFMTFNTTSNQAGETHEPLKQNLQPMFELHSKDDVEANVLAIYRQEKEKLIKYFDSLSCLLSLTLELWSSNAKMMTYCCLTVHFIDDRWQLKKKILAFRNLRYNYDMGTVHEFIKSVLAEWRINKNVRFILLDITPPKEHMIGELRIMPKFSVSLFKMDFLR
ncbi:zinc finger BED domain-containing protein [Salix suchowensis]|nr:zinc finger BED domain-containing protein [Salix suchowensis]